ncbi:hypothetical protein KC19_VG243800 [Ceratodon purpureus]|uniref:Uncharacterized protein n=1 Tax=Ceratodon purpureus TaxID=3225 RepID=A0A8T0HTN0_CERPU|nr:hypothetical protein KC19_VG243800 [Ceratodon purpureus]
MGRDIGFLHVVVVVEVQGGLHVLLCFVVALAMMLLLFVFGLCKFLVVKVRPPSRASGISTRPVGRKGRVRVFRPLEKASGAAGVRTRSFEAVEQKREDVAGEEWTNANTTSLWEEFYLGMCNKAADNLSNHGEG